VLSIRAGHWTKGERGLLSVPGVRNSSSPLSGGGFLRPALRDQAPECAGRHSSRRSAARRGRAHRRRDLRAAVPLIEKIGATILVEAINPVDMPGYFADTVERAAALVEAADSPWVRLQLDQYHVGMVGPMRAPPCGGTRRCRPRPGCRTCRAGTSPGRARSRSANSSRSRSDRIPRQRRAGVSAARSMDEALAWLPRQAAANPGLPADPRPPTTRAGRRRASGTPGLRAR